MVQRGLIAEATNWRLDNPVAGDVGRESQTATTLVVTRGRRISDPGSIPGISTRPEGHAPKEHGPLILQVSIRTLPMHHKRRPILRQRPIRSARLSFRRRPSRAAPGSRQSHCGPTAQPVSRPAMRVRLEWRLASIRTTPMHPNRRPLLRRRPTRPARLSFRRRPSRAALGSQPISL